MLIVLFPLSPFFRGRRQGRQPLNKMLKGDIWLILWLWNRQSPPHVMKQTTTNMRCFPPAVTVRKGLEPFSTTSTSNEVLVAPSF